MDSMLLAIDVGNTHGAFESGPGGAGAMMIQRR